MKLFSYILVEEYINSLALEMASPKKPALWQLYRHTFVPYNHHHFIRIKIKNAGHRLPFKQH